MQRKRACAPCSSFVELDLKICSSLARNEMSQSQMSQTQPDLEYLNFFVYHKPNEPCSSFVELNLKA